MTLVKISDRFLKSIKTYKNYKGLEKILIIKCRELKRHMETSHQSIRNDAFWCIKKLDATCAFGAYRIIAARSQDGKHIVYDFYFKNKKSDLDHLELGELSDFIKQCEMSDFYNNLPDFILE
jgi:hypothetical protein